MGVNVFLVPSVHSMWGYNPPQEITEVSEAEAEAEAEFHLLRFHLLLLACVLGDCRALSWAFSHATVFSQSNFLALGLLRGLGFPFSKSFIIEHLPIFVLSNIKGVK